MNLSTKLRKLVTGDAFSSAMRHLRQGYPRRPLLIDAGRISQTVRADEFQEIRRKHALADPGDAWPKYLDLERWMAINLRRVREVALDFGRRQRVLDLGCGMGYFLYICRYFGHEVVGLDIDEEPGFREILGLLQVPRVVWRIEAFEPLPDLGAKFDLISAHMICFNGHKSSQLWGPREWEFFLDDVARHLRPQGRILLSLNRETDGTHYTPELREYFASRGAEIHTQRVLFDPLRAVPAAAGRKVRRDRRPFAAQTRPHSV